MPNIQTDLMYLHARLSNLDSTLEEADDELALALVDKIDRRISNLLGAEVEGEVHEEIQVLKGRWEAIKGRIKPKAHIDTCELVGNIERIRAALISSSDHLEQDLAGADRELSPVEELAEIQAAARYRNIKWKSPKLIAAFEYILTQAIQGVYGERIQKLLDESSPLVIELRPLLRMVILEVVDDILSAPEFISELQDLEPLKKLLPESAEERAELREAIILGELLGDDQALEQELNRLTGLYSAQNQSQLEGEFKDIAQFLFHVILRGETLSTDSGIGMPLFRSETFPEDGAPGEVNSWLESLPEEIWNLDKLKYLDLGGNRLTDIPKEIKQLTSLDALNLSHNQIADLPQEMQELRRLNTLYIARNSMAGIPVVLGEMPWIHLSDW